MGLLLALLGAYGAFLVYTALVFGWRGVGLGPAADRRGFRRRRAQDWLAQAGLEGVGVREFLAVTVGLFVAGVAVAFTLFGGVLPALVTGAFAATLPLTSYRARRQRRRAEAREAWPRMIEEIRVQTGSLGRSIPQALFEVGRRGPEEL